MLEVGTCDVFVTRPGDLVPKKVKTYGPGSAFGELALLYSAPRAATVTTTAPCKVWVAERRVVATIKRHFAEKAAAVKMDLLQKVPMFGVLAEQHKQLLAGALEQVSMGTSCNLQQWSSVCAQTSFRNGWLILAAKADQQQLVSQQLPQLLHMAQV